MNVDMKHTLNKQRASILRKMLSDELYLPNGSYKQLLSDLTTKLHQSISTYRKLMNDSHRDTPIKDVIVKDLSSRQNKVIDKAILKYEAWIKKDSIDPDFISSRNVQLAKLNEILRVQDITGYNNGSTNWTSAKRQGYGKRVVDDMKNQLMKRKMLLTNKQKILCNKLYNEAKEYKESG